MVSVRSVARDGRIGWGAGVRAVAEVSCGCLGRLPGLPDHLEMLRSSGTGKLREPAHAPPPGRDQFRKAPECRSKERSKACSPHPGWTAAASPDVLTGAPPALPAMRGGAPCVCSSLHSYSCSSCVRGARGRGEHRHFGSHVDDASLLIGGRAVRHRRGCVRRAAPARTPTCGGS